MHKKSDTFREIEDAIPSVVAAREMVAKLEADGIDPTEARFRAVSSAMTSNGKNGESLFAFVMRRMDERAS